jgi:DNA-directed RNA polymerase specialized sigma24 family protein
MNCRSSNCFLTCSYTSSGTPASAIRVTASVNANTAHSFSVSDAEDVVQELFLDVHDKLDRIEHVKTYLTRATTNRCLNILQSARKKMEVYPGTWLPEPTAEVWQQPNQLASNVNRYRMLL